MPWCPHCKTGYQPGITKCVDCGAALVDHLPQEQLIFDGQPVFLIEVHHDAEAVLLVQLLQDNDIPSMDVTKQTICPCSILVRPCVDRNYM